MPKDIIFIEEAAKSLNNSLKELTTNDERVAFLRLVTDGICLYCGDVKTNCQCQNDE